MHRWILCSLMCLLALGSLAGRTPAHRASDPPHRTYQMGDFQLESRPVIKDFIHRVHRRHRQRPHDIAQQQQGAAADAVSALHHPRHGALAAAPAQGPPGHRPRGGGGQALHGRHAGMAVGRELPGLHGALVPLARTPAWSVLVVDASRNAIMLAPAWSGGNYTSPPAEGLRLRRDIVGFRACHPRRGQPDANALPTCRDHHDRSGCRRGSSARLRRRRSRASSRKIDEIRRDGPAGPGRHRTYPTSCLTAQRARTSETSGQGSEGSCGAGSVHSWLRSRCCQRSRHRPCRLDEPPEHTGPERQRAGRAGARQ